MISLFTLNLWRYYDFEIRFPKIVKTIKENNPDIIFLQEVQLDITQSPLSQAELIKNKLSEYKYSLCSTIYLKDSQKGEKLVSPIQHGMAILSKYPIINSFEYYVKLNEDELEPRSILCCDIDINETTYKFANIHFANKEEWAKNQMIDFMHFINLRSEKRIMIGDFNMFNLSNYEELKRGYKSSYDFKKYTSYPKDNGTLDYILIPESQTFQVLKITEEEVSDHKGIYVEIND